MTSIQQPRDSRHSWGDSLATELSLGSESTSPRHESGESPIQLGVPTEIWRGDDSALAAEVASLTAELAAMQADLAKYECGG